MEKKLILKRENFDIPAVLSVPNEAEMCPAVILCHGTGSEKGEVGRMFKRLSQKLSKRGIASISLDFACCGERIDEEEPVTFMGQVEDTKAAYDALLNEPCVDRDRIGILGFSQGARIMTCFAYKYGKVKALVSWSGTCHNSKGVYSSWFDTYREEADKNGFVNLPLDWREPLRMSKAWFDEIEATNPMDMLKSFDKPLLAVGGTRDEIVPAEHITEIAEAAGGKAVVIEDADHTFNVLTGDQSVSKKVIEMTTDWLCDNL